MEKDQKVIEGFSDVTVDEQVQVEGGSEFAGAMGDLADVLGMMGGSYPVGSGNVAYLTYY